MQQQATYNDAELILRLYELRREERLRTARAWFATSFQAHSVGEFMEKYPPGGEHNAFFRMVTTYWEMAATFVVRGIVHDELFFENSGELLLVWEKSKTLIQEMRQARKNPVMYRNLEKAAMRHIQWMNQQAPGAYEVFAAMWAQKK